jgi:hypothetical protein
MNQACGFVVFFELTTVEAMQNGDHNRGIWHISFALSRLRRAFEKLPELASE